MSSYSNYTEASFGFQVDCPVHHREFHGHLKLLPWPDTQKGVYRRRDIDQPGRRSGFQSRDYWYVSHYLSCEAQGHW